MAKKDPSIALPKTNKPKEKERKYEILHKDFEEYESRIEQNLTVKKELRASSHLFAADIEVGVYADNYHSALMAVTDSELLNDYVWDTAGNMEEEDINELIFEIYPEVAEFLSEINDNKENISFAFNDEKDMENFIKNYEEMIEQIRNFIVNETAEYKNSEKTKEMIEFLSKYSSLSLSPSSLNFLTSFLISTLSLNHFVNKAGINPCLSVLYITPLDAIDTFDLSK